MSDPDGFTLGLWGQYDLLSHASGSTYARGGLTYLDYEIRDSDGVPVPSELQFALGVGTNVDLTERVQAFTNLSYIRRGDADDPLEFRQNDTGIEVGIEISF